MKCVRWLIQIIHHIDVKIYWSDSYFARSQSNFESNVSTIKSFQSRASSIVTWIWRKFRYSEFEIWQSFGTRFRKRKKFLWIRQPSTPSCHQIHHLDRTGEMNSRNVRKLIQTPLTVTKKIISTGKEALGRNWKGEMIRLSFKGEQMESQLTPPHKINWKLT